MAGDDHDQAQAGFRRSGDQPGACGLVEVTFVRESHVMGANVALNRGGFNA